MKKGSTIPSLLRERISPLIRILDDKGVPSKLAIRNIVYELLAKKLSCVFVVNHPISFNHA